MHFFSMAKTYRTLNSLLKNHEREPSNFPDSPMQMYRIGLGVLIFIGSLMTIDIVWALVDFHHSGNIRRH